jgi:hypothetical protein
LLCFRDLLFIELAPMSNLVDDHGLALDAERTR